MAVPIWKDYYITLGSGAYNDYEVRLASASGTLIYTGRAYKRPGESNVRIRINGIAADWLAAALPNFAPAGFTPFELQARFVVVDTTGSLEAQAVDFYNDWSYDRAFNPSTQALADPVTGELDPRQHLIFSTLAASSLTATLTYRDGTTSTITIHIARSADFGDDFNDDFTHTDTGAQSGAAVLDLSAFMGLASVSIGGVTYPVREDTCARLVAYYQNARGGWDSLILDGICKTSDALTRHTTLRDYDNNDASARGLTDYAIEVAREWELRTGLLTDAQSERMHNLLNSPQVFLQDFAQGGIVFPVVLTDGGAVRQTFRGNGRRMNEYTFNAREAQQQIRR